MKEEEGAVGGESASEVLERGMSCVRARFGVEGRTRRTSTRSRIAKAIGPNVSEKRNPWYPSLGSVNPGNFPDAAQSNLPESMTATSRR